MVEQLKCLPTSDAMSLVLLLVPRDVLVVVLMLISTSLIAHRIASHRIGALHA